MVKMSGRMPTQIGAEAKINTCRRHEDSIWSDIFLSRLSPGLHIYMAADLGSKWFKNACWLKGCCGTDPWTVRMGRRVHWSGRSERRNRQRLQFDGWRPRGCPAEQERPTPSMMVLASYGTGDLTRGRMEGVASCPPPRARIHYWSAPRFCPRAVGAVFPSSRLH